MTSRPFARGRAPSAAAAIAAALIASAGCAPVGPDYKAPQIELPARWTARDEIRAQDPAALAAWWRQFDDQVLDALVTDALAANLDLATARAQLREARAQRKLAGAELGPAVDITASADRSRAGVRRGSGASDELYSVGFDATWEIDVFGGLRRGVEAAEATVEASLETLRDTQVSLVAEVVLNYVDLRTAELRLAIAEASLAALGETYDLTRWRQQAGLASELDVAQARTQFEKTRANLPSLRTTAESARHRLSVLLNRPPGEIRPRLPPTRRIPLAGREAAVGIPADSLRQRPDVRAAERKLAAQTARLGEAEAARYPRFTLSGSLGLEALTLSRLGSGGGVAYALLSSITAPILHSGRIGANIEIQDARLEQSRLAYRAAVLTALEDVENALVAVANSLERRERLTEATRTARQALQLAEQRYVSGLIDFLAVLDSRRTLQDLEDQLAVGAGDLATAQARLYKALGGGWSPEPRRDDARSGS